METRMQQNKADRVRIKLGFDNCFVVNSKGKSGGLMLLWNSSCGVEIQNYSRRHINAVVQRLPDDLKWKFTGFYGHPEASRRTESWALLRHLASLSPEPWLCLGDFNEIVCMGEKTSKAARSYSQIRAFQCALSDSGLGDLGFKGPKFTWCNGREGSENNKERLDRAVANAEWCSLFNLVNVEVLPRTCSDHSPILVSASSTREVVWPKSNIFRFEAAWAKSKEQGEVIKKVWRAKFNSESPWVTVMRNLEKSRNALKLWASSQKISMEQRIETLQKQISLIQLRGDGDFLVEEKRLKEELNNALDMEELKWMQRAKINWLKNGDRNSKFFHAYASYRSKKNFISKVKDKNGLLCVTKDSIEEAFVSYFKEVFSAGDHVEVEPCIRALECKVSPEMNSRLLFPFTKEEINIALSQMSPLKAPGPDGMSASFYQANWNVINEEVCEAALNFLNTGEFDRDVNSTFIALIPKVQNPMSVTDFRPISLCNVLYKLISKVLANRLKHILPDIISCFQSAFIPGRLISDNILAAYEIMHTMQRRMWSKEGFMGIKLDMSKAYDRVEWVFLKAVMHKLGFDARWVDLVMKCVSSVKYSVLINGNPVGAFYPSRGLRQGDPISPYLFLLCAECFSGLLCNAEKRGHISGVPSSPKGPTISHLLFADDCILFCKANRVEWRRLLNIISVYEEGSGQKVNLNKTSVFFSRNTKPSRRQEILSLSGLAESHGIESYLGLPCFVGKSRSRAFQFIKEKVWKKLNSWRNVFLSQAGREVLLKAVIQAIPTYCMSIFQLPISLCKDINSLMQEFWWRHLSKSSRINWMSWDRMSSAKSKGGLGFRDLVIFNQALLAKQGWRLIQHPSSLVAKIFQCKYYPSASFLEAPLGSRASFVWRSLFQAKDLLLRGILWRVGNGSSIRIWKDKWLPSTSSHLVHSPVGALGQEATVSQLIDRESGCWIPNVVIENFRKEEAEAILNIPLSPNLPQDRVIWIGSKSGLFSVKSAYYIGRSLKEEARGQCSYAGNQPDIWKDLWSLKVPGKVKMFAWRACQNLLPTRENLYIRKVIQDPSCPCCGLAVENVIHCLWSCPAAGDVWGDYRSCFHKCSSFQFSFMHLLEYCVQFFDKEKVELMLVVARNIWLRRNALIFQGTFLSPHRVWEESTSLLEDFRKFSHGEENVATASSHSVLSSLEVWCPPPEIYIKINWDASVAPKGCRVGLGLVARDSRGECICAKCVCLFVKGDPRTAESLAALHAVFFAKFLMLRNVIFEGDSLQVVKEINSPSPHLSSAGHITESILQELKVFGSSSFVHVKRSLNEVAHILAREALFNSCNACWFSDFPSCIQRHLVSTSV
jgi:hypothetical protein